MGGCRSDDLRFRVADAVAAGSSRRAAAARFSVSASSAIRWSARATNEGSAKPRKQGRPAGKGALAQHLDYLIAVVEAEPDITTPELAARLHAVHVQLPHRHAGDEKALWFRAPLVQSGQSL
jgi:transposase